TANRVEASLVPLERDRSGALHEPVLADHPPIRPEQAAGGEREKDRQRRREIRPSHRSAAAIPRSTSASAWSLSASPPRRPARTSPASRSRLVAAAPSPDADPSASARST